MQLITSARLGSSTWLLHLRAFAVVGQLMTILSAWALLNPELNYAVLLSLVGVTAVTNLLYAYSLRRGDGSRAEREDVQLTSMRTPPFLGASSPPGARQALGVREAPGVREASRANRGTAAALMVLDIIVLTAMLYFSGGADNPFCFFYFVNLAVGGVMLQPAAAWTLAVLASVGYAIILQASVPVELLTIEPARPGVSLRTVALMFAFGTCSSVVTYFVLRTAGELRNREGELLRTQAAQAASERLEGLTTLAAGAAHELATPLSTIDVIARELTRHLEGIEKPESVDTDLRLIDQQLEMCHQILSRMRGAAGDSMAQRWDHTTVGDLIDAVLDGIRDPHRVDVIDGSQAVEGRELWVPQEAIAQAIRNLIHNGLDASDHDGRVRLEPRLNGDSLQIVVADRGAGMTAEIADRATDPFFTTKEPGRGIGLGLFLTRNVISKLGGELSFASVPGRGTRATVDLPIVNVHFGPGTVPAPDGD